MILSSSPSTALQIYGNSFYFIKKHLIFLVISFLVFFIGFLVPFQLWKKHSFNLIILTIFLLLLTYIPGVSHTAGGASRWINLGFFAFQPSEFAKFTIILYFATAVSNRNKSRLDIKKDLVPILGVIGFICLLIVKQPSLSSTLMIAFTVMLMLIASNISLRFLFSTVFGGFFVVLMYIQTNPYQLKRVKAFMNPWLDPLGIGFHTIQSLISVGSGGLFGRGIGNSRQKFFYLPQQYTDFIFSIICEELGFILSTGIILLYLMLSFRGFKIASQIEDNFGKLLAVGITSWISMQAILNIGVVLSVIPVTGQPLPFISYGGTSLMMLLFAIGVLSNVSKYRDHHK